MTNSSISLSVYQSIILSVYQLRCFWPFVQQYDPSPAEVGSGSAVRITLGDKGAYEPDRLVSDTGQRHYFGGGLRSG
jgi:hypothetical protein